MYFLIYFSLTIHNCALLSTFIFKPPALSQTLWSESPVLKVPPRHFPLRLRFDITTPHTAISTPLLSRRTARYQHPPTARPWIINTPSPPRRSLVELIYHTAPRLPTSARRESKLPFCQRSFAQSVIFFPRSELESLKETGFRLLSVALASFAPLDSRLSQM